MGLNITITKGGEGCKREVDAVQQAAVEVLGEPSPALGVVHAVICARENPYLKRVGDEHPKYAGHQAEVVTPAPSGQQMAEADERLVVDNNDDNNNECIDRSGMQKLNQVCHLYDTEC